MNIEPLVEKSIFILREVKARFRNPAVLWSTGKDSTACLSLMREAFFGIVPFPVIHIDTGYKFKEIYDFRERIRNEWNLDLVIAKNEEALKEGMSPSKYSHFTCCMTLKTLALKKLMRERKYDALIVSIRRDESEIRNKERYFSPRDTKWYWKVVREKEEGEEGDAPVVSLQDTELAGWNLYATDFGPECEHVRVHPLLHWTEVEVWYYTKDRGLPVNPLYFSKNGKRYRSLGCYPCTQPVRSEAKTMEEIIRELLTSKTRERAGRVQDKEKIMQRLRFLGYM